MKILKLILPVALLLPVLFFASEIITLEFTKTRGKELILPIAGYDPRDLLSGHYLQYNIGFQTEDVSGVCKRQKNEILNQSNTDRKSCICYPHLGRIYENEGLFVEDCNEETLEDKSICNVYLRGTCKYGRFEIENGRYYVNEQKALEYEKRLRKEKVHIRLKVNQEGKAITDSLIWEDGSSL
ncbi:GDYXXLXY domain-containing protein [Leptospira noguchii]|uniref:GDYXXLXY protein n=1 Tax=Leptospira noguchii serovar Autumnalis str. ZUN142 TaxID=1085540 RepID=M6U9X2_9LEPT|nr:GDYXXLXY domain-containing protein [Leptospira noguchii]EMO27423.1 GDYXXLXY protein [Leptospira interrogans serovar Bataviae str. HAI135]EKR72476.1 GDYXXLXY protein [Leptospira noguchii str. 2006001870]EMO41822.1 GDYXXLXY protein [Leptospira noguchii serovar Autumnalis str. ZUN142]UOG40172.1 GDYXXLXY domain-containing protein [Leptospira noguchii]UOG50177.1 GDYXXLXY domain-containing protein [Leptospira noguchii]